MISSASDVISEDDDSYTIPSRLNVDPDVEANHNQSNIPKTFEDLNNFFDEVKIILTDNILRKIRYDMTQNHAQY